MEVHEEFRFPIVQMLAAVAIFDELCLENVMIYSVRDFAVMIAV